MHEVLSLCAQATHDSDGWFSIALAGSLDPSRLVKGWAAEAASQLLYDAGAHRTCVNGGGDLQLRGQPIPRQAVAHRHRPRAAPRKLATVITAHGTWPLPPRAPLNTAPTFSTHTTAQPATTFASLTLIGPRLTLTDTYTTAAFARGNGAQNWVETLDGYEALAVLPDGQEWRTPGFRRYGS
ncbi:FAD:protein FMN transferase [Streptomyces sp. NPDC056707]|uniref:FAD:protein FMN transferase n=1 Tax=Streptomyces sp. NPDC056707 TaxID=3345919 RepID=UPI0036B5FFF5